MRKLLLLCAMGALWGCRISPAPENEVLALYCSTLEQSKTDLLPQGDEIGVFAAVEGTEDYFLDNAKFVVGSDGRSLNYGSTVYYPDPEQAVRFLACFPYHTGVFSVPNDQSTALALKEADLCGATARTTPVATPVALAFEHLMARVVVQTNKPTTKISFPNALSGGALDVPTGRFNATTRSDLSTTGNELIVPVQPLARLVLTVSGVEYVFDTAPIALQTGQTTTLNLTLNPSTKTATLSGSSTTNWISSATQGNPTQAVSNTLTLHWPKGHPQSASANKIVLTIKDEANEITANYTVASEISYTTPTFTIPFASAALHYPYTIVSVAFYQNNTFLHESMSLIGGVIVKSGACVVGIRQPLNPPAASDYVVINGLKWAKGNLIALNKQECKVGVPADYGVYFQYGSLIGWSSGSTGTGVGQGSPALDKAVWPATMGTTKPSFAWPFNSGSSAGDRTTVVDQWFFNYNTYPYSNVSQDIRGLKSPFTGDAGTGDLGTGRYAKWGVGDPCSYYLGGTWRLPLTTDHVSLCNNQSGSGWLAWTTVGGGWTTSPTNGGNFLGTKLFIPVSGYRDNSIGAFFGVATFGYYWSSSVHNATDGYYLLFSPNGVIPQFNSSRALGFPARCVSN